MSERLSFQDQDGRLRWFGRDEVVGVWEGRFDKQQCPVVSGRRVVPLSYVPVVRRALAERRAARQKRAEAVAVAR
jgi:hypothetical protein